MLEKEPGGGGGAQPPPICKPLKKVTVVEKKFIDMIRVHVKKRGLGGPETHPPCKTSHVASC